VPDDGLHAAEELPAGLHRSAVHDPGFTRLSDPNGFSYRDHNGVAISDPGTLDRIQHLAIPPAWSDVWISPDPAGHVQAMGTDSRGRRQYRYHELWRAARDRDKFGHMLRFAAALPALRSAALRDLGRAELDAERVCACALRVTELGLFRIGSEKYAREDHTYGAASLERRHVLVDGDAAVFDYVAKESKHRTVRITDAAAVDTLRALVSAPATVPDSSLRARRRAVGAAVHYAADWLGDTPSVARGSYVDPAILEIYETTGGIGSLAGATSALPADPAAEREVLTVLTEYHRDHSSAR
jgi:DNA topoisomerase IB